jgi:hypothetical protein
MNCVAHNVLDTTTEKVAVSTNKAIFSCLDKDAFTTTLTGPNGQTASRTVTGRGTGAATVTRSGPRGTVVRHR